MQNMLLLKDKAQFDTWRTKNIFYGDIADDPKQYPCFVRKKVLSWRDEEEEAVYLYKEDLERMLDTLSGVGK